MDEMTTWMARPLEPIYAAVFIDAIVVKVRDVQVRNQPYYAAIGVDLEGHKDILGIWPGNGDGESAKFWFACLTEQKFSRRQGRVLHGLRRVEGPARQHRVGVPGREGPDLTHPSAAQQFRLRLEAALARDRREPQARLRGPHGGGR